MWLEPGWWESGGGGRPDAAAQNFQAGKWFLSEGVPFSGPPGFSGPGKGLGRAKPEELGRACIVVLYVPPTLHFEGFDRSPGQNNWFFHFPTECPCFLPWDLGGRLP